MSMQLDVRILVNQMAEVRAALGLEGENIFRDELAALRNEVRELRERLYEHDSGPVTVQVDRDGREVRTVQHMRRGPGRPPKVQEAVA